MKRSGFSLVTVLAVAACAQVGIGAEESAERNVDLDKMFKNIGVGYGTVDIGGQFRARYEVKENAGSFPNEDFIRRTGCTNDNSYLLLREKVNIGWTPAPWLKAFVEGRNSSESGDKRHPSPESDEIDLHQAYISVGDAKTFPLLLKLGRQEMKYGDEHWIGVGDWSNVGRVFDAGVLRFQNKDLWVDGFVARQVYADDDRFNQVNRYDVLSGIYASSPKGVPWQETQLYFLARNASADSPGVVTSCAKGPNPRDVYTVGTRWKSTPGEFDGWDYGLEVAYQFGNVDTGGTNGVRLDQNSCGMFVSGGYTWQKAYGTPRLGLGYDYSPGDGNPKDDKSETFDNLFGTAHRFYGQMDLFGLRNMHIPRVCASIEPVKGMKVSTDYLMFWAADTQEYLYPETASARTKNGYGIHSQFDSHVGSELDVVANYGVSSSVNLQLGYGHFFVGEYIRESLAAVAANKGAEDADWYYAQVTLSF